jgi:opacity protein-like surface antigen
VGSPAGQALRPFAQVLLGGVRRSADFSGSATVGGMTISESDSESSTDFGFDVGGGVDFLLSGGIGVRAKASYLRVTGDDGGNAFRFQAGVVIPF